VRAWVKRHAILSDRSVSDDCRCQACDGVCCRSFVAVELTWAEYERLEALGAQRLEFSLRGPHRLLIENGCEFLVRGRCAIYEHRPELCRRFICDDVVRARGGREGTADREEDEVPATDRELPAPG
jgi:Fe-S-cluster containining protein